MSATHVQVNRDGSILLPDAQRQRFGLREGSVVIAEERVEGILLRPADLVEMYTPERKAEFLLGNATSQSASVFRGLQAFDAEQPCHRITRPGPSGGGLSRAGRF